MKIVCCILMLWAIGLESTSGQGTVQFANNALSRVTIATNFTTPDLAPIGTKVGLFWGGVNRDNLTLTLPVEAMSSPGIWRASNYINYPLPGTVSGQRVYVKIASWDSTAGDDWQAARYYGESEIVQVTLGPDPINGVGTIIWQPASGTHPERAKPFTIYPVRTPQTIEFPEIPDKTFGDPSFTLNAVASSGLPVIYSSSDPVVASVNGAIVTILRAGTSIITASQEGNSNFYPTTVSQPLIVRKATATILLSNLDQVYNGDVRLPTVTTEPANLPVVLDFRGPEPLPPVNAGTYEGSAVAESDNYFGSVTRPFTVAKAPQAITFADVPRLAVGAGPTTLSITASSGLPVSLSSSDPAVVQVDGLTVTPVAAGQAMLTASQTGNENYLAAPSVSRSVEVTAEVPFYSVSTLVSGAGSVVFAPSAANYVSNTTISITAVPAAGWVFDHWTSGLGGSNNPASFIVRAPAKIGASFAQVPALVMQPVSISTALGSPVTFHVEAVGSSPLAYQWWFGSSPLLGGTNADLHLTASLANEGSYHVVVSNPWGSVSSAAAMLQVNNPCPPNAVAACDEGSLQTAVLGGGVVRFCCDGTIVLTSTLEIAHDVALDAQGHSVTISGNRSVRLFSVRSGVTFAVTNITLADGLGRGADGTNWVGEISPPPPDPGKLGEGGAILNNGGNVILASVRLLTNSAQGGKGGTAGSAFGYFIAKSGDARGGAIANLGGTLRLFDVVFSGNSATGGLDLLSTFQSQNPGQAGDGLGGAIYSSAGEMEFDNGDMVGNVAFAPGGGTAGANARGGAIFVESGPLHVQNILFSSNAAVGGPSLHPAGGIFALTDSSRRPGNAYGGAMAVMAATVSIESVSMSSNHALGGPGNRHSPTGEAQGGALHSSPAGSVRAIDSTFSANEAIINCASSINAHGRGGGIFAGGSLQLDRCSVIQNRAVGGNGFSVMGAAPGGAYAYGGGLFTTGDVVLTNCTIALNTAAGGSSACCAPDSQTGPPGSAFGGGWFVASGTFTSMNSTLASNVVTTGTGPTSIYPVLLMGSNLANSNGAVSLRNTVLAYGGTNGNASGVITDGGFNMSSDNSANFSSGTSVNGVDPRLGPVGDQYGGPTPVMPLRPDSPAIDAGTGIGAPAVDQRGASRPFGGGFDMGAYEYHSNQAEPARLTIIAGGSGEIKLRFEASAHTVYQLQTGTDFPGWTDLEVIGPFPTSTFVERTLPLLDEPYRFFQTSSPPP